MSDLRTTENVKPVDIVIVNGDLVVVEQLEAVRQRLEIRLDIQKGEWFMDLRDGLPWRESVFVRNPDIGAITALFTERILSTPDVLFNGLSYPSVIRLDSFSISYDNVTGDLRIDFRAITPFGTIAGAGTGEDLSAMLANIILTAIGTIA